jgi:hypothetical protein
MKEKEIAPGTVNKHMIVDPETGKEVEVETIAAIDLNPGDLDPILEEIKKIMYEKLKNYPKLRRKRPIQIYYKAIREMYRKKHPRLVQYMNMLKDNEKVNIHTATEEQISKIGESEETTPISLSFFTEKIGENIRDIAQEFAYRMSKEDLASFKSKGQKKFVGKDRFV